LDLMRVDRALFLLPSVSVLLASCVTSTFRVAAVPVFRRTQDVSIADIEAAISAYKTTDAEKVGPAEVISHDAIRIYQDAECRNFTTMVRVKGNWQLGNVVLVHPI